MELIMKKLLYLICLLSFGQIFSADNGQPPAKRQRVGQHKQSFDFSKWRMHDDDIVKSCKTCGKIFPDPNDEEAIEGHERFCNPNKKPRARRKKYSLTNTDLSSNLPLSDGEKELATALLMLGSDLGKRPAPGHTDGEPPAKRQKVAHAGSAESISKSEDSESSQGEDEEFLCQYCGEDLNSQRALDSHEQTCSQRPDLLNTQQEFNRWQNLSAQQQQLQQQQLQQQQLQQQQLQQQQLQQQQLQQQQLQQWQLQQRLQQQLFAQQQQQLQQQQLQQKLQQQLQQQKQSEEQEKDSALSVSSSEGQDQELYQKHLVENPDKTFGCKACEKQYKTKYAARVHIKGKHGKKDLTDDNFCDLCGKTLGSRDSYNRHMKGHTNQEPTCCFQNRGCTYSGRRDNLKRHELKCVFKDKKLNQQQLVPIFTPEQLQNLLRQAQQSLQPQQGISAEQQPQAAVSSDDDDDDDDEDDDSDENEV
jgi:uncharacterized protein YlaI